MDEIKILEILNRWNFWKEEKDTGIERGGYIDKGIRFLRSNVIIAIIGVRRSGKSFIMRQIARHLIGSNSARDTLIVDFEDPELEGSDSETLNKIYEVYVKELSPTRPIIFLDEIHIVTNWEKWVRMMHELGKARIFISGSSSKLLSGELSTVIAGRHLDIRVFPLSFNEFLDFRGIEIEDMLDIVDKRFEIERSIKEYLEFGGFPEVVLSENKRELLTNYWKDIIYRDVILRFKIRKIEHFRSLGRFYLTNISSPITFNRISKFLGISDDTVETFSRYLVETFSIFFVKRFSFSLREQENSPRKVYSIDNGLSNAIGFRFSDNFGRLMENLVAIELKRRGKEIYYWKDYQQREVDFVVKEGLKVKELIQVCYDIEDFSTKNRELRALIKASKELKCKNLSVITWDYEGEEEFKNRKIKFIPLWRWLLS